MMTFWYVIGNQLGATSGAKFTTDNRSTESATSKVLAGPSFRGRGTGNGAKKPVCSRGKALVRGSEVKFPLVKDFS